MNSNAMSKCSGIGDRVGFPCPFHVSMCRSAGELISSQDAILASNCRGPMDALLMRAQLPGTLHRFNQYG